MASDAVTPEILAALDLPPAALRRWLDDLAQFARAHGGERRYRELLALLDACRAAQDRDA
ncbi:MAG: hypothetical protein K8W52_22820 [Deltaproteobacteria bacterium]|nr:hypothetical protein [Deltaproteobacteria bacterium]